jgi:hypothetical protein
MRPALLTALLITACGSSGPKTDLGLDRSVVDQASRDARAPCAATCGAGRTCVGEECVDALAVWPNKASRASSDPWLAQHHAELRQLRPRILALNYVNAKTNAEMTAHLRQIFDAMAEASRFRGHANPAAAPQLRYELAYAIDLRDDPPPAGWPYNNSTQYPRETPVQGTWGFDYGRLFTRELADQMAIKDPAAPSQNLDLCELVERGLVHEVWVYGDADKPDASAAEILEAKPFYDIARQRVTGKQMSVCAGNGCFDSDDAPPAPCTRTVRIGWVNHNRGPGCFIESLTHGFERLGNHTPPLIPYLAAHFPAFAGFDLDKRYGLPFDSWYACDYNDPECLSYPTTTSATYHVASGASGTVEGYDPVCGNVHFPPNARRHYDLQSSFTVDTSCESYAIGGKGKQPFTIARFAPYQAIAGDCMGAWLVYFRQNVPGYGSTATALDGKPMLSWWPFIYY